jgi:Family of unknown function (DUF5317)
VLLVLGALAVGVLAGLALGGSLRTLAVASFRWWPLALVGLALQVVPVPSDDGEVSRWLGPGLLIASYAILLVFVGVNIRLPGFPVIAAGFLLNAVAITLNGGMPVNEDALRTAAGPAYEEAARDLSETGGSKHHLAGEDDMLLPITDVIPVGPPIGEVLSPGDVLAMVGAAWLIAGGMRRPLSGSPPETGEDAEGAWSG